MTRSLFASFWRKRAFENNPDDPAETFLRQHPEFLHFRRVHDRLNERKQDLDNAFCWNIFAYHPCMLPLNEKLSKVALNQRGAATLDNFEHLGRLLPHIELPRKISVKRFLADPQLKRKIIHGHTAEPVTEEVAPGSLDHPLAIDI